MTVLPTDSTQGWFTLIHHDVPIEYSSNIQERLKAIDLSKPENERAERKRCIVRVPDKRIPLELREAWGKHEGALAKAHEEARAKAYEGAWAWVKAFERAWAEYNEARAKFAPVLLALMFEYVPDAPWDMKQGRLVFEAPVEGRTV